MSQYICTECGHIFEEPRIYKENHGEYWGAPAYEEWSVCPVCGESGYEDYYEYEDEYEDDEDEDEYEEGSLEKVAEILDKFSR